MNDLELVTELVFMLAYDEPDYLVAEKRAMKLLNKFEAPYISPSQTAAWSIEETLREWSIEVGIITAQDIEEDEEGADGIEERLGSVVDLFIISRKTRDSE